MIVKEKLKNGLTLVTEQMPQVRSVAIGVWLRRGSRHETPEQAGLSHFIEHMVFKGTKTRSAEDIASEVDSIGGHMDAFTAKEYAAFHLKVLDQHLPLAIDILADIVRHPRFDPLEMAKEKKVIAEEMGMVEDTPDDIVVERFTESFWPDHPLGRPILGTRRSLQSFRREHLAGFFKRVYRPRNLVVAAAGQLDHGLLARLVGNAFGDLPAGGERSAVVPPVARPALVWRSKKELEQVHLCLGTPAYRQGHPRRFAAHILNTVLGGSMSSRLFQNVRERRGLVYSISSGIASYSDAGNLTIYAAANPGVLESVIRLSMDEMRRMREDPVPENELRRAKDQLKGSLMLSLEGTGSRMNQLARQEIYFGRHFGLDEILGGIEAVSADDVLAVARELFAGPVALSLIGNLGGYRPRRALLRL